MLAHCAKCTYVIASLVQTFFKYKIFCLPKLRNYLVTLPNLNLA